jgi:16S rRNA (guanine527-N7)-methyltransferase
MTSLPLQSLLGAKPEDRTKPANDAPGDDFAPDAERKLAAYLDLLVKWNRVYNLTAIRDREQMKTHHLLDSLAIVAPLATLLDGRTAPQILDVGSGAGLPGIPLAIARPDWFVTLVDSNGKKTAFMQQVAAEVELPNVRVLTTRAENMSGAHFDVIVARAFSSLRDLVLRTRSLLAAGGYWAAMKGAIPDEEIRQLPADVACAATIPLAVPGLDAARHLIVLAPRYA